jgi:Rha family phage regulatory protein
MENLVIIKNGKAVTDSLTIAEVFGKKHDNVLRDVRTQVLKLEEANLSEFSLLNFEASDYEVRGKSYFKYNLTEDAFALVVMSYVSPSAMEFKVKFLQEFKRMKEQLQGQPRILTEREQLMASLKLSMEAAEEIPVIKQDVLELKDKVNNQMTIDYGQQSSIWAAKNKRVEKLWGDNLVNTEIFDTKRKLHSQAWRDLKLAFGVASYRDIRRKDYQEAMAYITGWRPRIV